jgi:hypothetical protein
VPEKLPSLVQEMKDKEIHEKERHNGTIRITENERNDVTTQDG